MVQTLKKLVLEKGILSSSSAKPGRVLPPPTAEMIKQFYVSDEISRDKRLCFCTLRRQDGLSSETTDTV
jgi:hypothetical protein